MKYSLLLLFIIVLFSCKSPQEKPNVLDQVLRSGKIRIGTTGDYKPFTFLSEDGEYSGIDIELAKDLARSLDAEIIFIPTTWPTLMEDLKAGKFDIAVGGISKKLSRQQVGFLSDGYAVGGKTPIARCKDILKFNSLSKIDQAGVKIIVNPGGTNQTFVNSHIKNASIRVFEDNKTIFKEIELERADVMITDSWEVKLQSKLSSHLCPTMPNQTFDKFEKTFLMPRDIIWKEYVNAWLSQAKLSGNINEIFSRFL